MAFNRLVLAFATVGALTAATWAVPGALTRVGGDTPADASSWTTHSVLVSPDNSNFWASPSTSRTVPFTLYNYGDTTEALLLSATCTGSGITTCQLNNSTVFLAPLGTYDVTVTIGTAGTSGLQGRVKVAANYFSGSFADSGAVNVSVTSSAIRAVEVRPKARSLLVGQNTSVWETFWAYNVGNTAGTFSLQPSCSGTGVTSCSTTTTTPTLNPSASTTYTFSYSTTGAGNSGKLTLKGLFSGSVQDSGWVNVSSVLPIAVVEPDAGGVSKVAATATNQVFTLRNYTPGYPGSTTYTLEPVCTGTGIASGCTVSPTSITAGNGAAVPPTYNATLSYTTAAAGTSGVVKLRAKVGSLVVDSGWVNLTVTTAPPTATVTPDAGTAAVNPAAALTQQFTVTNTTPGTGTTVLLLQPMCSGAVADVCSVSPSSLSLANGGTANATATVSYTSVTPSASGKVVLRALNGATVLDSGYVNVTTNSGSSIAFTLTKTSSSLSMDPNSVATAAFTITNNTPGSGATLFNVLQPVCSGTGLQAACTSTAAFSAVPNGGGTGTIYAAVYSNGSGSGQIVQKARPLGLSGPQREDTVAVSVTSSAVTAQVTPDNATDTTAASSATTRAFSLVNTRTGGGNTIFDLVASCSGATTGCDVYPTSYSLPNGVNATAAPVVYYTTLAGGTGKVVLRASVAGVTIDTGYVNIVVPAPAIVADVTPSSASATVTPFTTTTRTFTVVNNTTGSGNSTFTLMPACYGTYVSSACSVNPEIVTLPNGSASSLVATVTYSTLAQGSGSKVVLRAMNGAAVLDTARLNVTVTAATNILAAVTPDSGTLTVGPSSSHSQLFVVANTTTGSGTVTFGLQAACTGTGVSGCQVSPENLAVPKGGTDSARVTFTSGAGGTSGKVTLKALVGTVVRDTGWVSVGVQSAAQIAPEASVEDVNPGRTVPRSLCFTMAIGAGAASECGDLRLTYGLPAVRTMNTVRTPTLIYSSQQAAPVPSVAVKVTLPAGLAKPSSVEVSLIDSVTVVGKAVMSTTSWLAGEPRLVRVRDTVFAPTGAARVKVYKVKVASDFGGGVKPDTTILDVPVLVVDRSTSQFGKGWWLAGHERVVSNALGTDILWVGGDGSAALYKKLSSTVWEGQSVGSVARIVRVSGTSGAPSSSGSKYRRELPDSTFVYFTVASGLHDSTVNRLGHRTTFGYAGSTLNQWCYPVPTGAASRCTVVEAAGATDYRIAYGGRVTRVGRSAATAGRLLWITDSLSGRTVTFTSDANGLVSARKDRRNVPTMYSLDGLRKVRRSAVRPNGATSGPDADSIVVSLRPFESVGSHPDSTVPLSAARTIVDRPRSDVADSMFVTANQYGAPTLLAIQNGATADTTTIDWDSTYIGLARHVKDPVGQNRWAYYDADGKPDSLAVQLTADTIGVTRYAFGVRRQLARTTSPENRVVERDLDLLGRPFAIRDGRAGVTRLTYDPSTALVASVSEVSPAGGDAVTTIKYNELGNDSLVTTPLGYRTLSLNDAFGRPYLVKSYWSLADTTKGRVTTTTYSSAGWDSVQVAASGSRWVRVTTQRDAEGSPTAVTREWNPNQAGIAPLTIVTVFDSVGRPVKVVHPGGVSDSVRYDVAGNAVETRDRRGLSTVNRYDTYGRLEWSEMPAVTYTAAGDYQWVALVPPPGGAPAFPWYSGSDSTRSVDLQEVVVPGDTTVFTYDRRGSIATATNRDAVVTRTYDLGGRLRQEDLQVRNVMSATFGHTYISRNDYDRDGLRTRLLLPTNVGLGASPAIGWTYGAWGAIDSIVDPRGNRFRIAYWPDGSLQSLVRPAGVVEEWSYDHDGRMTGNTIESGTFDPGDGTKLRQPTVRRLQNVVLDGAGRLLSADDLVPDLNAKWNLVYDDQGQLLRSRFEQGSWIDNPIDGPTGSGTLLDSTVADGIGNVVETRHLDDLFGVNYKDSPLSVLGKLRYGTSRTLFQLATTAYEQATGRTDTVVSDSMVRRYEYDAAGNTTFEADYPRTEHYRPMPHSARASYYDGAGRLVMVDSRDVSLQSNLLEATFEEYRYDPLGRRILVRTRRTCEVAGDLHNFVGYAGCGTSTVRRTIWDGAVEIAEIQRPGGDDAGALAEADTGATIVPRYDLPQDVTWVRDDPNRYFGNVVYTPGLRLDQPLSVTRVYYTDKPDTQNATIWPTFTWMPFWDRQGFARQGLFSNGKVHLALDSTSLACNGDRTTTRCVKLDRPFLYSPWDFERVEARMAWHGSVLSGKRDASGLDYRRNRYYDPESGRFTQEDPIGLAGGINLYGFASGDPVNFSDPFGLAVCFQGSRTEVTRLRFAAQTATNSDIKLDSDNCVESVTSRGNASFNRIREYFQSLVDASAVFEVNMRGRELDSPQRNRYKISIFEHYNALAYPSMVNGQCVRETTAWSLSQVLAHELFHHYTVPSTGRQNRNELRAVEAENLVNSVIGRPQRCAY